MFLKMFVPVTLLLLVSYTMPALTSPVIASHSELNRIDDTVVNEEKNVSFPDVIRFFSEQVEKQLTEMCQKAGVKNASITSRTAVENAKSCIENVIEFPKLGSILQEGARLNSLNSTLQYIKNNCEIFTKLRECSTNKFLTDIEPCITNEEKPWLNKLKRLDEAVTSFVCDNKGHNIDVFIEEKGPECIESKESSLKKCTLITEGTHLGMENDDSFSYETNPYKKQFKAIFNSQKCKFYSTFSQCALKEIRTCPSSKPAVLMETLYKTVVTPTCNITTTP